MDTRETLTDAAFDAEQNRDFRAFHEFMRFSRMYINTPLVERVHRDYRAATGAAEPTPGANAPLDEAAAVLDALPSYQMYAWGMRNVQQFKYGQPGLGIASMVRAQSEKLAPQLEHLCEDAGDLLRLNPKVKFPAYYDAVDFHQHPGGVWGDALDGLIYEYGRRTTVPAHGDGNKIYRQIFAELPQEKTYEKVLDWGCGHGAGIVTWADAHPESECYGVDLSAPCLKLAHVRAKEHGHRIRFSQQDLAAMDFADDTFDLAFHVYMLHEIPANETERVLREVHRVLKPGGIFIGMELALVQESAVQNVLMLTEGWLNNEPYMSDCFDTDYGALARRIGFANVVAEPFQTLIKSVPRTTPDMPPRSTWNLYKFTK